MSALEQNLTTISTAFNILNSIPLVSLITSPMRVSASKTYFVGAMVFAGFSFMRALISSGDNYDKWMNNAKKGANHMIYAGGEAIRGVGETLLAVTVVGSLIPLTVQLISSNGFAPILKYE